MCSSNCGVGLRPRKVRPVRTRRIHELIPDYPTPSRADNQVICIGDTRVCHHAACPLAYGSVPIIILLLP